MRESPFLWRRRGSTSHATKCAKQAFAGLGTAPEEKGVKIMKLSQWMVAKAVVVAVFGVGFVLVPVFMASVYGMTLDATGTLMARLFGTSFIFEGIVLWFAKGGTTSERPVRGLVTAVVVSNAIGFIVCLMATLSGVWNAVGWLSVGLYLVFGLAFAYFLFKK